MTIPCVFFWYMVRRLLTRFFFFCQGKLSADIGVLLSQVEIKPKR